MSERPVSPQSPSEWNERQAPYLPGYLGVEVVSVEPGEVRAHLSIAEHHLAPNGFLHAGTLVTLADTCCGYGTVANLPEGSIGFTTIELKSNFLGTAREGDLVCVATPAHRGRTTQVWDALVMSNDKTIAIFRCTQMVLMPR